VSGYDPDATILRLRAQLVEAREALERIASWVPVSENGADFAVLTARAALEASEKSDSGGAAGAAPGSGVFAEIAVERNRQDAKWGGPDHDDGHGWHEWIDYIIEHAGKAYSAYNDEASYANGRRRYIEVAALAVAAVESMDRTVCDHATTTATALQPSPPESASRVVPDVEGDER